MKIISLNIWCGKIFDPLINFIKKHANDVDIFCFQEVLTTTSDVKIEDGWRMNIFQELEKILPQYKSYFAGSQDRISPEGPVSFANSFGLAMFIKKDLKINLVNDLFVFKEKNACTFGAETLGRNMQFAEVEQDNSIYTICNLHGLWNGKGKSDSEERLLQSNNIKNFLNEARGHRVLCGDFNLAPDTESLKIIKKGMIDLIEVNKIKSTRSSHYRHYGEPGLNFADYVIISPDVKVNDFKVLQDSVSDHLPLYLDFS